MVESLDIVGVASLRSVSTRASRNKWLEKIGLPHVNLSTGCPTIISHDDDYNRQQVLLYDSRYAYRHDLCGPGSSFGKILQQISSSSFILEYLASIQSFSNASSTSNSTNKIKPTKRPKITQNAKEDNTATYYPFSTLLTTLETYSMLAHHVRKLQRRRAQSVTRKTSSDGCCLVCQKPIVPLCTQQKITTKHWIGRSINTIVGVILGLLLVGYWPQLRSGPVAAFISNYFIGQQFLSEWLTWLESFPIGFKLNVPLTQSIGREIRSLLSLRRSLLQTLTSTANRFLYHPQMSVAYQATISVVAGAFGGSGCLAVSIDILHLLTLHLDFLSQSFRFIYRTEIYLLGSMWRLFRGKKQNVLRRRTDTMEYDSMQLLLGSILFVVTLFLLTTILVYYAFFSILNLLARTNISILLWLLYILLEDFPFGTICQRATQPERFTSKVLIRVESDLPPLASTNLKKPLVARLDPQPQTFGSILASTPELSWYGQAFKSWLGSYLMDLVFGNPTDQSLVVNIGAGLYRSRVPE